MKNKTIKHTKIKAYIIAKHPYVNGDRMTTGFNWSKHKPEKNEYFYPYEVFQSKKDAEIRMNWFFNTDGLKIIPCTIFYKNPFKLKKGQKYKK